MYLALVINISSSSPAINKLRRLLPAISAQLPTVLQRRVDNTSSRSQRWQHAMKPDIGSESRFLFIHLHLTLPLKGSPSENCH